MTTNIQKILLAASLLLINQIIAICDSNDHNKLEQSIESVDGIDGRFPTDFICKSAYYPYYFGDDTFNQTDMEVVLVDGIGIKEILATDSNDIVSFLYKFKLDNQTIYYGQWTDDYDLRQFIDTITNFDMLINTTIQPTIYTNDNDCRCELSPIKLEICYTKNKSDNMHYQVNQLSNTNDCVQEDGQYVKSDDPILGHYQDPMSIFSRTTNLIYDRYMYVMIFAIYMIR